MSYSRAPKEVSWPIGSIIRKVQNPRMQKDVIPEKAIVVSYRPSKHGAVMSVVVLEGPRKGERFEINAREWSYFRKDQ